MIYRKTVLIGKEKLQRVNRLLAIDDLRDMSNEELEKIGAKVDDAIHVLSVVFENDFQIDVDVCSGNMHYYDVYVLRNSCGYEVDCFESKYFVGDKMSFSHGFDRYEIDIA